MPIVISRTTQHTLNIFQWKHINYKYGEHRKKNQYNKNCLNTISLSTTAVTGQQQSQSNALCYQHLWFWNTRGRLTGQACVVHASLPKAVRTVNTTPGQATQVGSVRSSHLTQFACQEGCNLIASTCLWEKMRVCVNNFYISATLILNLLVDIFSSAECSPFIGKKCRVYIQNVLSPVAVCCTRLLFFHIRKFISEENYLINNNHRCNSRENVARSEEAHLYRLMTWKYMNNACSFCNLFWVSQKQLTRHTTPIFHVVGLPCSHAFSFVFSYYVFHCFPPFSFVASTFANVGHVHIRKWWRSRLPWTYYFGAWCSQLRSSKRRSKPWVCSQRNKRMFQKRTRALSCK